MPTTTLLASMIIVVSLIGFAACAAQSDPKERLSQLMQLCIGLFIGALLLILAAPPS